MKSCPVGKNPFEGPCPDYSKEGLCDWPYRNDLDVGQIKYLSQLIKITVDGEGTNGDAFGNGAAVS